MGKEICEMKISSFSPSTHLSIPFISLPLFFLSGGSGPLALTGVSCCRKWRDHFYPSLSLPLSLSLSLWAWLFMRFVSRQREEREMNRTKEQPFHSYLFSLLFDSVDQMFRLFFSPQDGIRTRRTCDTGWETVHACVWTPPPPMADLSSYSPLGRSLVCVAGVVALPL